MDWYNKLTSTGNDPLDYDSIPVIASWQVSLFVEEGFQVGCSLNRGVKGQSSA